ncbi:response regulator transcription factor [Parasediminibacterium sp. JCM 36343]|uniref:response regulator transcription factor n=1 Tax=Parasediminibacterium sp. JCM 36343 TaxID=3374279 RepID=UPI00397BC71D
MLSIALLDDHELLLKGTATFLQENGYSIAFTANNFATFKEQMVITEPDLAIVDCIMPGIASLRHLKELNTLWPQLPLIAYTQLYSPVIIETLKRMGVKGYCNKKDSPEQLVTAIKWIVNNKPYYPKEFMEGNGVNKEINDTTETLYGLLSGREYEVLTFLAKGMSNKEIASKLFISLNTVEFHRKNIAQKLGANNTAEMVLNAVKQGLI